MNTILNMVNEAVDILIHEYTYNRVSNETKHLIPYCRFAVEKFIFEKLFDTLYEMYKFKNSEIIGKF